MAKMSELELRSLLDYKINNALGSSKGELADIRQESYDYYNGEPYGNEVDGQSSIVTRECLEAVEWAMPSLMRVFTAGDKVVKFDPVNQDDEQASEQETDLVNHVLLKENNGYLVLHHWFKDALTNPTGYVKVYWDETDETTTETYDQLTEFELQLLVSDPEVEIVSQSEEVIYIEGQPTPVWAVEIQRTCTRGKVVVEPIPPEEILIDSNISTLTLDKADFSCHRTQRTYSDLINQGFDRKKLDKVGTEDEGDYNEERINRRHIEDETFSSYGEADSFDKSMRKYWVHECYIRMDYEGKGTATLRKITKIGSQIFDNEEIPHVPVVALGAILMQHKHTNMSLVELTKDIQLIKSTLMRQLLDNLYKTNNPRTVVGQGVNLDDLLVHRPNQVVRAEDISQIRTEPTTSVIGQVIPALEILDSQKEGRTGISRHTMGLDADTLAQSTKGAFMGAMEQANQRLEMITRTFAETGVKELMLKTHHLLMTHMDKPKAIKIRGKWIELDPSQWKKREDMTVTVGIGNGNREQTVQAVMGLLQEQKEMLQIGLVSPQNLHNAYQKLVEAIGLRDVDLYFQNPEEMPTQAPPPPDPQMMAIQVQQQVEQAKLQNDVHKGQAEMQLKRDDQQIKLKELALKEREIALKEAEMALKYQDNGDARINADAEIQKETIRANADIYMEQIRQQAVKQPEIDLSAVENAINELRSALNTREIKEPAPPVVNVHIDGKGEVKKTATVKKNDDGSFTLEGTESPGSD